MRWMLVVVSSLVACAHGPARDERPPICSAVAACRAHDGQRVTVVGVYRQYPDQPGVDYSDAPRAVRIELDDGLGPFVEPFWSPRAIRPAAEIEQHLGKRVRVTGRYHSQMPANPDDPPQASAMGGPCVEVETIELAR